MSNNSYFGGIAAGFEDPRYRYEDYHEGVLHTKEHRAVS